MSSENYRIEKQDSVYFLTFTVTDWVDVFTRMNYRSIITESVEFCRKNKGLKLYAWCLMTNHIHLVCSIETPRLCGYAALIKSGKFGAGWWDL
jgi:REP element-mobilizing transposase RayT